MSDGKTESVVIADPVALLREGIGSLCEGWSLRVAAQCADGGTALRAIETHRPDVAILDLCLPTLDTLELIRRVRQAGLGTKLLVLSARDDRKTVTEALRGGAHGFVLKSDPARHLREAICRVLEGSVYVSPTVGTDWLFGSERERPNGDPLDALSSREHQVFRLLVDGLRAKEIAARLELSAKTVDTYRASLMRKLDIHDLAGLVKFAIQRNLTAAQ
jgi:DNA-binding NarL/FixJ family response regulator